MTTQMFVALPEEAGNRLRGNEGIDQSNGKCNTHTHTHIYIYIHTHIHTHTKVQHTLSEPRWGEKASVVSLQQIEVSNPPKICTEIMSEESEAL